MRAGSARTPRPWVFISAAWVVPALLAALAEFLQARSVTGITRRDSGSCSGRGATGSSTAGSPRCVPAGAAASAPARRARHEHPDPLSRGARALRALGRRGASLPRGARSSRWAPRRPGDDRLEPDDAALRRRGLLRGAGRRARHVLLREARERAVHAARLSSQLAEARLGALRSQLNPHFLFNSLNAITVLVRDQDTPAATRMLEQLGEVLRQVLHADRAHEVPLTRRSDSSSVTWRSSRSAFPTDSARASRSSRGSSAPGAELRPPAAGGERPRPWALPRTEGGTLTISVRREGRCSCSR